MKNQLIGAAIALTLFASTAALAQRDIPGNGPSPGQSRSNDRPGNPQDRIDRNDRGNDRNNDQPRWSRGDRVPDQYRQRQYAVSDWRQHNLRRPPQGYRWIRNDNNQFLLAAVAGWIIADVVTQDQSRADRRWSRGERLSSDYYRNNQYFVSDWRGSDLRRPARGYRWFQVNDQYVLAATASGLIIEVVPSRR